MHQDLCINYTTKTFIIKTTPIRNPFLIPPILMWPFLWSIDQTQNLKNIFYNLSSFVLVIPIIANWQNPRCKKLPKLIFKMKQLQQRPLPARDVRPLTTIFVWPTGQIKDKNKCRFGTCPELYTQSVSAWPTHKSPVTTTPRFVCSYNMCGASLLIKTEISKLASRSITFL